MEMKFALIPTKVQAYRGENIVKKWVWLKSYRAVPNTWINPNTTIILKFEAEAKHKPQNQKKTEH